MAITGPQYLAMRAAMLKALTGSYPSAAGTLDTEVPRFFAQFFTEARAAGVFRSSHQNLIPAALRRVLSASTDSDVSDFFVQLQTDSANSVALSTPRYFALRDQFLISVQANVALAGLSDVAFRDLYDYLAALPGVVTGFPLISVATFASFFTTANVIHSHQSEIGVSTATGVSSWNDPVKGVAFTQATAGKQPTLTAGLNGFAAILLDGIDDTLDNNTVNLPAPLTTPTWHGFVLRQISYNAVQGQVFGDLSGANQVFYQGSVSGQAQLFNGSAGPAQLAGMSNGQWVCGEYYFSNSAADYMRLGSSISTGSSAGNGSTTGLQIGNCASSANRFANIEMLASIRVAGLPSAGQIAAWRAAVTAKYGASVNV
jgi:hypothetical protein